MNDIKIWIIKPKETINYMVNPWEPWYDTCVGMVIFAETEKKARELADADAEAENRTSQAKNEMMKHPWLYKEMSVCKELVPGYKEHVVITDRLFA